MKETYLVTGFARSGTSMMMRALYEGMEGRVPMLVGDPDRTKELNKYEYQPNAEYLEPPMSVFQEPDFPVQYEGMLMKVLMAGLFPLWPVEGLRVVMMWRDPNEIKLSWEKALPDADMPDWLPDGYLYRMRTAMKVLENRKDLISLTHVSYSHCIEDPIGMAFGPLKEAGWDLDVEKAAAVIDPTKHRHRVRYQEAV